MKINYSALSKLMLLSMTTIIASSVIQAMDAPGHKRKLDDSSHARREGNERAPKKALNANQDINATSEENMTALHIAIRGDNKAEVVLLLSQGEDPAFIPPNGVSPLQLAVQGGNMDIIRLLLEHPRVNINATNVIAGALINNRENTARLLLRHGAYADITIIRRLLAKTPLFYHAALGECEAVAQLIKNGSFTNKDLHQALAYAAARGHENVTQLLLDAGAEGDALLPRIQILREQTAQARAPHAEVYRRIRLMLFSHFPHAKSS